MNRDMQSDKGELYRQVHNPSLQSRTPSFHSRQWTRYEPGHGGSPDRNESVSGFWRVHRSLHSLSLALSSPSLVASRRDRSLQVVRGLIASLVMDHPVYTAFRPKQTAHVRPVSQPGKTATILLLQELFPPRLSFAPECIWPPAVELLNGALQAFSALPQQLLYGHCLCDFALLSC